MPDNEPPPLLCPTCDYSLTGLVENRCPECGKQFDPVALEAIHQASGTDGWPVDVQPTSVARVALQQSAIALGIWCFLGFVVQFSNNDAQAFPCLIVLAPAAMAFQYTTAHHDAQGIVLHRLKRQSSFPSEPYRKTMIRRTRLVLFAILMLVTYVLPASVLYFRRVGW